MNDRISAAIKLKNAKMPVAGVLMFALAIAGDVHDTFFDHTEDEAKATADKATEKMWEATWEAFEAKEKLSIFAAEAQKRIQFLEKRADTSDRNTEKLRDTIDKMLLQDRDHRGTTTPRLSRAAVPRALKPDRMEEAAADGAVSCAAEDPLCESADMVPPPAPVQQQVAPMPSVDEMWKEKKEERKQKFKEKFLK
jgi:hypothetical protein